MPIEKAVEIMWLQPGASVGWTWDCRRSEAIAGLDPAVPPPLYFWFIPLAPRSDRAALSVSRGEPCCRQVGEDCRWRFEWQIANRGECELPLKINIWTPIGAEPCASMS